jgi:O-antigen/teichoic acid export membrane protein
MPETTLLYFFAYLGPGLGAGAVAAVIGILASIFLALFAILWYPFKRLIKRRKKSKAETPPAAEQ